MTNFALFYFNKIYIDDTNTNKVKILCKLEWLEIFLSH